MINRLLKKVPTIIAYKAIGHLIYSLYKLKNIILPSYASLLSSIADNFIIQRCIYIAADLGIADKLKGGPKDIHQLSGETNTNEDALYRVMRALASQGIFKESGIRIFSSTRLSRALEKDKDDSILGWVKYFGSDWHNTQWNDLKSSVINGKDACQNLYGITPFEWFEKNPLAQDSFNEAMDTISNLTSNSLIEAYNFSRYNSIVDVGGGKGNLLSGILHANKHLTGILFDLPEVIANSNLENGSRRIEFISGSFFETIPAGKDIYIMKSVLHDWEDEKALNILQNVTVAMHRNSRLLVIEIIIEEGNARQFGKLLDVAMLVASGGRERTEKEYHKLFKEAGLKMLHVIPTASPFSIMEITRK